MEIKDTLGGQAYLINKQWEEVKQEIADAMHIAETMKRSSTKRNRRNNIVIFVEGNIGAGKSTFLRMMESISPLVNIVMEPVPAKYLNYLCNDPAKWAFPFQLIMATLRKDAQDAGLKAEQRGKFVFLERSLHADAIFANIAIQEEQEKQWYRDFKTNVLGDIIATPNLIVYLDSSVDGCMQRIERRASEDPERKGELKYDEKYIKEIKDGHDKWIYDSAHKIAPVLVINTDLIDFRKKAVALAIMQRIAEMVAFPNECDGIEDFTREDVLDFVEDTMEMEEYEADVDAFANELGIDLKNPNDPKNWEALLKASEEFVANLKRKIDKKTTIPLVDLAASMGIDLKKINVKIGSDGAVLTPWPKSPDCLKYQCGSDPISMITKAQAIIDKNNENPTLKLSAPLFQWPRKQPRPLTFTMMPEELENIEEIFKRNPFEII